MKTIFLYLLVFSGIVASAQTPNVNPTPTNKKNNYPQNSKQHTSPNKTSARPVSTVPPNNRSTQVIRSNAANGNKNQEAPAAKSPFVGGIHAAPNAAKTYDTIVKNGPASNATVGTVIPGGNDTTFNVNTLAPIGGVGTNSGAVDRSGQSQFGQTNWGRSERNTVGESQWTIPPPITASFNREFPASNSAAWTRNNVDTNQYNVRYKSGAVWVTSTYDAAGTRINMRTEVPLVQPPAPVSVFIAKQPSTFQVVSISRLQMQGRPEVYELKLANGETAYINTNGMEVKL